MDETSSSGAFAAASLSMERLKSAAAGGDVDKLYTLIAKDPYLLDRIDHIPFVDTPLHVAASAGHSEFAAEIMLLKPSFARKLNEKGLTPLHIATQKEQTKMVDRLLDADANLVRVQGKEVKTPFHYAAEQGNFILLNRFLSSCPSCIQDVTKRGETALHIVVERKNFTAFQFLVVQLLKAVHRGSGTEEKETLNKKNDLGNTVLHIAVETHQPKVVKMLIDLQVELDVKKSDGLTALDLIIRESHLRVNKSLTEDIEKMLRHARATRSSFCRVWKLGSKYSLLSPSNLNHNHHQLDAIDVKKTSLTCKLFSNIRSVLEGSAIDLRRGRNSLSEESRDMLLVALVLLLTLTSAVVLSPPGGFWQDNTSNENGSKISHPPAGTVVMGDWIFFIYMSLNNLIIVITVYAIIFLIQPEQEEPLWWFSYKNLLVLLGFICYLIALHTISPNAMISLLLAVTTTIYFVLLPLNYTIINRNLERRIEGWKSRLQHLDQIHSIDY